MSSEENRFVDLKSLEAALASLAPRTDRLDRDRLMFRAGQASLEGRRPLARRGAWPVAFSAMTALAAALLVALVTRPSTQVVVSPPPGIPGESDREAQIERSPAAPERPKPDEPAPSTQPFPSRAAFAWLTEITGRSRSHWCSARRGEPEWLEAALRQPTGPFAGSSAGPDGPRALQPPVSHGEWRESLLGNPPPAPPPAAPSILEMLNPLGARS